MLSHQELCSAGTDHLYWSVRFSLHT